MAGALLVLVAIALAIGLARENEVFAVDLVSGRAKHVRGRIPPRLLADLDDVARRAPTVHARIHVVVRARAAAVRTRGAIDAGTAQRVRNLVGLYRLQQLRAGRPPG